MLLHMSTQSPHTVISANSCKVKLVNWTVFLVDTNSLRDMKGLDSQHVADPIVIPQPHNQDICWESQQDTLPLGWSPFGIVHSAAAEDQSLVEKIDQINEAKLFLQYRDRDSDQHG